MAMCEEVVLDETGSGLVTEGDGRTLKRVQIKLEHGVGIPQEVPQSVDLPSHRSPDTFLAGTQEEAVIHQDAEEIQQQQQQQDRQIRDDPLARAVKVTQSASGGDVEQGMPGILTTNGAVVRMGASTPQQGASSVQNAIVSGCLLSPAKLTCFFPLKLFNYIIVSTYFPSFLY